MWITLNFVALIIGSWTIIYTQDDIEHFCREVEKELRNREFPVLGFSGVWSKSIDWSMFPTGLSSVYEYEVTGVVAGIAGIILQ